MRNLAVLSLLILTSTHLQAGGSMGGTTGLLMELADKAFVLQIDPDLYRRTSARLDAVKAPIEIEVNDEKIEVQKLNNKIWQTDFLREVVPESKALN